MIKKKVLMLVIVMSVTFAAGIAVSAVEENITMPGVFVGESITIEEEPTVEFTGVLTDENDFYEYSYTAPRDGTYLIESKNLTAGTDFIVTAYDPFENQIAWLLNDDCASVEFKGGETYIIQVPKQGNNKNEFKVTIYTQKETVDVTEATEIHDQIVFYNEHNKYTYTASEEGYHRIDIDDTPPNVQFKLVMINSDGTDIINDFTRTTGKLVYLYAGETYEIQVAKPDFNSAYGQYTLHIYAQKVRQEIAGAVTVSDSMEFKEQKNYYDFTAPMDGTYKFELLDVKQNNRFSVFIKDDNNEVISEDYQSAPELFLEEGKTYTVVTRQREGKGTYILSITYPEGARELCVQNANKNEGEDEEGVEKETEGTKEVTVDVEMLKKEKEELESEVERLQEENDTLRQIITDSGLKIPDLEND